MSHPPVDTITLQNPVADHYATWIFGNATKCEHVVEEGSAKGQTVVICGAGPSLRDTAAKWCPRADQVWGCNSALTWLYEQGYPVTHGFTVDQTAHMVAEWASAPPVEYLVASTIHPHLTDLLMKEGRTLRFFHNYVGVKGNPVSYAVCRSCDAMNDTDVPGCANCGHTELLRDTLSYEDWIYSAFYPSTVRTGSGLNATTRAIDLALFMGFKKIIVLGADCALVEKVPPPDAPNGSPEHVAWLKENTIMHADGGSALASEASAITLRGQIDGRYWLSKPDMLITAVWLVKMKRALGSRLSIMGDTLPRALLSKSDEFLARLPTLVTRDGTPIEFQLPDLPATMPAPKRSSVWSAEVPDQAAQKLPLDGWAGPDV